MNQILFKKAWHFKPRNHWTNLMSLNMLMKNKISYENILYIFDCIKNHTNVSIPFLMRKFKFSYERAQYIAKKFQNKEDFMSNILQSTDYSIFKRLKGNRIINQKNLKNIMDSIKTDNKLHLHPIIVNEQMYIIDGQHRLEAAKILNLPIHYIISGECQERKAYDHIMAANINQRKWTIDDFLNLYSHRDNNEQYKEFISLMEVLDIKAKALIGLIFGNQTGSLVEKIKTGEMVLPLNKQKTEKICNGYMRFREFALARKIKPISMFTTFHFTNAFRMLVMNDSCDLEIFFNKLENRWYEMKPQATIDGWFKILIGIYNWKNANKIEDAA